MADAILSPPNQNIAPTVWSPPPWAGGLVVLAYSGVVHFTDPTVVEAAALLDGIRVAVHQGYKFVILEAVIWGYVSWETRELLLDCCKLLEKVNMWESYLVSRSAKWCPDLGVLGCLNVAN
ncbi:hypothetical protein TorRG33x02_299750 [Trema orientale]|uniref:RNase H type-1 domain-containing protein n=1 Tax=Trema orientale TaxID=63057 RepID=A0A2P5C2P1_TREOI|nr:hypothetical protein TorRG33x02_299750 [Trema orientale]